MTQFEDWLKSSEILMKSAFDLTLQCIAFGETRLQEDFDILGKLMACQDQDQVADCHKEFAEKASRQYRAQFKGVSRQLAGLMGTEAQSGPIDVTALPD